MAYFGTKNVMLVGLKGDKGDKGDTGGVAEVVQVTGQATDTVMSQKAVTDELNAKQASINLLTEQLANANAIVHETVAQAVEETLTSVGTVSIPSTITVGTTAYPVINNTRMLLSEVKGKTESQYETGNLGSLPVGTKIKIPHSELGDIIFQVADKNHEGYPESSVTLITKDIILFRCVDAMEPNNPDINTKANGNNKYSVSNIDQWLNSSAGAGDWYSPRHAADQSPTNAYVYDNNNEYDDDAGFLNGFAAEFVSALKDTTLKVALNTVTDGGSYESITRKFFLASRAEIFGTEENSIMEGSTLSLFSANTNACRIAVASAYAAAHSEYERTAGTAYYWWLRTPISSSSYSVRSVYSDGALRGYYAYFGGFGVRPLCNLDSGISVSATTDADDCYTIINGALKSTTFQGIKVTDINGNETVLQFFDTPQTLLETDTLTITKNTNDLYTLYKNGTAIRNDLTYEQVTAITEQGGTISIIGNSNESYNVKPDLSAVFEIKYWQEN